MGEKEFLIAETRQKGSYHNITQLISPIAALKLWPENRLAQHEEVDYLRFYINTKFSWVNSYKTYILYVLASIC